MFLDKQAVKPMFLFDQFGVDPGEANVYALFVSEETYARATCPSHTFDLSISLEYHGVTPDPKYRSQAWITYDPATHAFKERLTHSQEPVSDGRHCHVGPQEK